MLNSILQTCAEPAIWKIGRNFLFNDELSTLDYNYIGTGYVVKDLIDNETGNLLLLLHKLLFSNNRKEYFIFYHPIIHTTPFDYTSNGTLVRMGKTQ